MNTVVVLALFVIAVTGADKITSEKTCQCRKWGKWSEWEKASKCTVHCGGGEKNFTRTRHCTTAQTDGSVCEHTQLQTATCNDEDCGALCPNGTNTYIAADDQHFYYHCQHGDNGTRTRAILMTCPEKTLWNQEASLCLKKKKEQCTDGELSAHPRSCKKFIQCSHGEKVLHKCPSGLHFNALSKVCDWPANAKCTKDEA